MITRHRCLPSDLKPFCSRDLKVKPSQDWIKANAVDADLVFGLDWTETHRAPKVARLWSKHQCHFPMMDPPYLSKNGMMFEIERLGLKPPVLYGQGYHHNNCSGGCVRNGLAAWRHHAKTNPEHFERMAQLEDLIPDYAFAKRRGGPDVGKPYPLRVLASELPTDQETYDFGGCGCFVDDNCEVQS